MAANKGLMLITLITFLFTGIQISEAQSPEHILQEMRSLDLEKMSMKQYYEKLFAYYDSPSRRLLNNYLKSSADGLGMSVNDYLKMLDGAKQFIKQTFKLINFNLFTTIFLKGNPNNVCISNYSEKRSIDKNDIVEITETADFNIDKYVNLMEWHDSSIDSSSIILVKRFLGYTYQNGRITNKTILVKENGVWKVHITKRQANKIFPRNKYIDNITESIPKSNEVTPKPNESTTKPKEAVTPKPDENTTTNTLKNKVEDMLAQAQQFEKDNNFKSAAEKYKKIALDYPYSEYTPMSIQQGAIDYFRLKQYDNVINIIKLSNPDNKQNTDNLHNLLNYLLGMSYYLKKNPDYNNTVFYLEKVVNNQSKSKNTPNALSVLGICYENMQHYNEAIEIYKKIYNIHGANQSKALYKIGELYSLKNEFDVSNKYLTQYLRDFPNSKFSDIANYRLGKNYLSGKVPNYDSAIIFFHSALSNAKGQKLIVKLYYYLGECYYKLKKWDSCRASFNKVMKAPLQYENPYEFAQMRNTASIRLSQLIDEIPKDYYHRGIAALDSSEYQKAYDYFNKLIRRKDEDYYTQSIIKAAWCKFQLKEYDKAFKLLEYKSEDPVFSNDETYRFVYVICLLHKKPPKYSKALERLKQLNLKESPSRENENLIYYYTGLCYEKKGDKETFKDARDDYYSAITTFQDFINNYPDDNNYSTAKEAVEKLNEKIKKLDQKIKDNKIFKFGDFFTYKKRTSKDTLIITIVDLLKGCFLQPDAISPPGLIYIPVNIDMVHLNQKVEIILQQTPFIDSRLAYLNIFTVIPKSNLNVFNPSISIQVSQDYECCKNGTNKIEEKNTLGIWDEGLVSDFDYSKPLKLNFTINSLGRSFHGSIGSQKKESPLLITIFLGNSVNVVTGLINNAKKKGSHILYISSLGTD